jgi:predicted RNase H-like HicB family nuclease
MRYCAARSPREHLSDKASGSDSSSRIMLRERGERDWRRPSVSVDRGYMLAGFAALFEKGEKYYIGYCHEAPGANGQGKTLEECRESLKKAIKLILQDKLIDAVSSP